MKRIALLLLCVPLLCCACASKYVVMEKTEEAPVVSTEIIMETAAPELGAEIKEETPEPAAQSESSAPALPELCELGQGASVVVFENGEKKGEAALTSLEDGECVDFLFSAHLLQSAAWPGSDPKTLQDYTLLRFNFADAQHECYIYPLPNGQMAFQDGTEGMFTIIGEKCLPALETLQSRID